MTLSQILATAAFSLLGLSALVLIVRLFSRSGKPEWLSAAAQALAAVLLAAELVMRSFQVGFVALTSTYESLLFYAAVIAALLVWYRFQKKLRYSAGLAFGAVMVAIIMMAVASSPLIAKEALPPIPALRSGWLVLHVSFSFIGEAFFVVSFVASILFLATKNDERRLDLDRVTYTSVAIGYVFFTAGALAFGAIWAEQAWGRWWSWDPKETWALVTWLVYTAYLHVRLVMKRKDSWPSIISVAGFLCTVFTFFGVNYLLPGLHSYG
ncbi:MAG TPA: cytochrome c biogenesis protein CcsA [Spirochaetales bacterium]|nr:cytochrome c biogenesis protein CcsA [Spirochaetales bacterium]MBP7263584.1 cytochrome c biogenesis protein CcsA [Spirochaetia bacterium]HPE36539.1 cytochrome c biogenesis protein CcsA [Spirochaetales bacterium]